MDKEGRRRDCAKRGCRGGDGAGNAGGLRRAGVLFGEMCVKGVLGWRYAGGLAVLLGSMLESNMRRALVMSHGSWATFVTRPVSCVLFIAIILTFCWPILKAILRKRKEARAQKAG